MKSPAVQISGAVPALDHHYFELRSSLELEPVEDGFHHPAEAILRSALAENRTEVKAWFEKTLAEQGQAALAADLVKCLGRLKPKEVEDWGLEMAQRALGHPVLEVRDSAVQALELWDTPQAIELLKAHQEKVPWLQEYISRLLHEIG